MTAAATGQGPYRVVGVIHLPALPGAVRGPAAPELERLIDAARRDAAAWAAGGADALMVENFNDVPFRKGPVGPETIAAMTLAVAAILAESGLPTGVNVLRNDVEGAVAIAAMTGARFVRRSRSGPTSTSNTPLRWRAALSARWLKMPSCEAWRRRSSSPAPAPGSRRVSPICEPPPPPCR